MRRLTVEIVDQENTNKMRIVSMDASGYEYDASGTPVAKHRIPTEQLSRHRWMVTGGNKYLLHADEIFVDGMVWSRDI